MSFETILAGFIFLVVIAAFFMMPFYAEYRYRKRTGKLNFNKSFFENYFNPPLDI